MIQNYCWKDVLRGVVLLAAAAMMSGCESVRGAQERLSSADVDNFKAVCPSEAQLIAAHAGVSAGAYRDGIIMVCVKAINSKYSDFTNSLSTESTVTNLVTDVAAQGLASASSVITNEKLARQLAAGSAFASGVNGIVNKDLFYKQTLPAIVASMDAKRSKVLTGIVQSQNSDPEASTYTLARAGADLDRYQDAGSLTGAVSELTNAAVVNAAKADAALQVAQMGIDIGTDNPATSDDILSRAKAAAAAIKALELGKKATELLAIATALNINIPPGSDEGDLGALIRTEISRVRTTKDAAQQVKRMGEIEQSIAANKGA